MHLDFDSAEVEVAGELRPPITPEEYFQREWVRSVFSVAVDRLRARCEREGKQVQFAIFEAYDLDDDRGVSYRELAARFDIPETQVTNYLAAMRRRFREIVLEALREVTATDQEFRAEARALSRWSSAMRFLSDDAVAHLREITELPDLSGTRYELVRELGRGGMGVVYEVRDRELERIVAMKVVEKRCGAPRRASSPRSNIPASCRCTTRDAAGRAALLHDEARARRAPRRVGEPGSRSDGTASSLRAHLRAGRVRACERRRASRSQAGERDGRRVRRGAGDGLGRRGVGNAGLHGAGADAR